MKNAIFAVVLVLAGCSGESFTAGKLDPVVTDADPTADSGVDAVTSTGGQPNSDADSGSSAGGASSGGAPTATGGALGSTGGIVGTGGTKGSGGSSSGGSPATGSVTGTGGAVDACTLVTHDNGVGQTWQDCVPLGTYNEGQAMKACKASGAAMCLTSERCGVGVYEVQGFNADRSHLTGEWGYGNFTMGYVSPNYNLCNPSDPARRIWT
jgi:hypothetical protein